MQNLRELCHLFLDCYTTAGSLSRVPLHEMYFAVHDSPERKIVKRLLDRSDSGDIEESTAGSVCPFTGS